MARIVIVDDSESVRGHLLETLSKGGHEVTVGTDGEDGVEKIVNTQNIDLLISDFNMPNMNGLDMLRKVTAKIGTIKFPVCMLTTETSDRLKAEGKELGVMGWINKPFNPEKLLVAVQKILDKKKEP